MPRGGGPGFPGTLQTFEGLVDKARQAKGESDAARAARLHLAILNTARGQVSGLMATNIALGIGDSMVASAEALGITQRFVGEVLAQKKLTATERRNIHRSAGDAAQRSMLAGYDNRRNRKNTPTYRTAPRDPRNVRLAGGILRRALRHPAMVEANSDGVRFINADVLDREAAHWRRINFGAGAAAGPPPGDFAVRWGSLVIGSLGLTDPPSPRFKIPKGTWLGREFYPKGEGPDATGTGKRNVLTDPEPAGGQNRPGRRQKAVVTAGIAASQFMDVGVRRLATELPRGYVGTIERIYLKDKARFGEIALAVDVPIKVFRPPGAGAFKAHKIRRY